MALQQTYEQQIQPLPVVEHLELALPDGARTTVHYAKYARTAFQAKLVRFNEPTLLLAWCQENGHEDAINGGFFLRSIGLPLGEIRIQGETVPHVPFASEKGPHRGSVYIDERGNIDIGHRTDLPIVEKGDLLQVGPLLVKDSDVTHLSQESDPELFSVTSDQHDSDITAERHPRAAIGCSQDYIWTVTADGRHPGDAGLYLHELAAFMHQLGAERALNLDGGRSSTHVSRGSLINKPRSDQEESPNGFEVFNAIVLSPRDEVPDLQIIK